MRGNLATHDSFLDRQVQHHALITAILAFLLPVVGVLYLNPFAIILGIIALGGGARGYGIAVLVIVVVKMVITPTFWLNLAAGSQIEGWVLVSRLSELTYRTLGPSGAPASARGRVAGEALTLPRTIAYLLQPQSFLARRLNGVNLFFRHGRSLPRTGK